MCNIAENGPTRGNCPNKPSQGPPAVVQPGEKIALVPVDPAAPSHWHRGGGGTGASKAHNRRCSRRSSRRFSGGRPAGVGGPIGMTRGRGQTPAADSGDTEGHTPEGRNGMPARTAAGSCWLRGLSPARGETYARPRFGAGGEGQGRPHSGELQTAL